ncbi:MAG: sugar ABC transporter substrate-binding protein [Eubacteriales bacterium]|nr:sugar ABC transporter substrate-binding protein [Eubacteriales bacterium]
MKKSLSFALAATMIATASLSAIPVAADENVTISFWDGNWDEAAFENIKALWEEEHPDIKLEPEFLVDNGMSDKYTLALSNGTAPDVVACALDWTTTFGNAGYLASLNEFVEKDGVDLGQYVQGAINASTIDGELYALPFRSETYALYYNVDLLAEAGYTEPPKTWDEVKEIAAACTKDDVAGYGLCGANYGNFSFQYITMLRSSGGSILNEDNTESALGSDAALQTAQLYKDLAAYAPASMLENDNIANRTLFANGKVAMYMSGIYDAPEIVKANPDLNFACAMVPTANDAERSSILGGWSVAVSECSENKEAAWEFVKWLTSPEIAKQYTNTFTGTGEPAVVFDDIDDAIVQPNADALAYAKALPSVGCIVNIRQTIFDDLSLMLSDSVTVEEAVQTMNDDVTALLTE